MDPTLKLLADAATNIAQGKGVTISPEQALELAQKGAEVLGAFVSDMGWKAARAAGEVAAAQVKTEDDAEREQRGGGPK